MQAAKSFRQPVKLPAQVLSIRTQLEKENHYEEKHKSNRFSDCWQRQTVRQVGNMGQLAIPGTSIQYSNPKQIDQATNIDPLTGQVWKTSPFPASGTIGNKLNGTQLMGTGGPQPGSFDLTPPTANAVLFGKQPPSLSSGGTAIPNS